MGSCSVMISFTWPCAHVATNQRRWQVYNTEHNTPAQLHEPPSSHGCMCGPEERVDGLSARPASAAQGISSNTNEKFKFQTHVRTRSLSSPVRMRGAEAG